MVLVDISQLSSEALRDVLAERRAPVVASHSTVRGLLDAKMMRDLRDLRRRYGLAAPQSLAEALTVNDPATADWPEDRFWAFLHAFHEVLVLDKPTASLHDLGDAIDYAVKRIGIDHVGIASDFNHGGGVIGWMHAGETVNVTAELFSRGYTDDEIAKLWGGNYLRAWQTARDTAGIRS